MSLRTFITQKLGIDKAIFYFLLSRGLSISTALFTVFFIAKNLSPEEQGFYYTFGSIVALQVFFELGLTGIITQFVALGVIESWRKIIYIKSRRFYKSFVVAVIIAKSSFFRILKNIWNDFTGDYFIFQLYFIYHYKKRGWHNG